MLACEVVCILFPTASNVDGEVLQGRDTMVGTDVSICCSRSHGAHSCCTDQPAALAPSLNRLLPCMAPNSRHCVRTGARTGLGKREYRACVAGREEWGAERDPQGPAIPTGARAVVLLLCPCPPPSHPPSIQLFHIWAEKRNTRQEAHMAEF